MTLQSELSYAACYWIQFFSLFFRRSGWVTGYFGISKQRKTEKFNVLSVFTTFSTPLSLPTFIDMLTDGFHGRRRKVPGGAAGLQNHSARLKKVKSELGAYE